MKLGKRTYEPKRFSPKHYPMMVERVLDYNGEVIKVGDTIIYAAQEDFRYSQRGADNKSGNIGKVGRLYLKRVVVYGSHWKKDGMTIGLDVKGEDSKRMGCIKVEPMTDDKGDRIWKIDKAAVIGHSPLPIHNKPKRMVCPRKGCEWPLEEEVKGSGVYQCMRPDCDYIEIV